MAVTRGPSFSLLLPCIALLLILCVRPTHAFGAGNIASTAKIEGSNWRHGDIEDTLLTLLMTRAGGGKKFSKMDVKRIYFGNWLRDYSQAVDVGTVKAVSAEAIRLLLWVLGFLSFGFGTKEFEVTTDRLGCYRPEEHIDNPKDYADNLDARQYDRRLRGPIDERRELAVDERTGLKNYIASEDLGITTSAGLVRDLFRRTINLGRQYNRNGNKDDLYEAFRLLGTACHCLEDYSAHSNYVELCLIEMGERDVFPHVGRRTQVRVRGAREAIWPLITGTFGGVDFLHSVCGEISDKATQSEVEELEGAISSSQSQQQNASMLKDLLKQLPDGLFGGNDEASKADELQQNAQAAQMQNMHITPKDPEEFTQQVGELTKQIYPILEFHDEIMHGITEAIESIPVLPALIESVQEQINIFVFSLLAPFVLPIIRQVKTELSTGSSEIIKSSMEKQHIVFNDDHSSDPTHSMLSKDHFTNVLNEPAGKVASQVLKWVVPQIVECWDDERADADRAIQRIVQGVFHHPALREYGEDGARDGRNLMFSVVEGWWREQSQREQNDLRDKLSRSGVEQGRNHKEGVHDSGHGCGKPIGMPGVGGSSSSGGRNNDPAKAAANQAGKMAGEAVGGGALGGLVGGLVGGVGASLLGGAFDKPEDEHQSYKQEGYGRDGSHTTAYTETAHRRQGSGGYAEEKYGQAEYKKTEYQGGGSREEYKRHEQDGRSGNSGYGFQQKVETKPTYGGGYERREETRVERPGGWKSEERTEGYNSSGQYYSEEKKNHGSSRRSDNDDDDSNDDDSYEKKERKRREKDRKAREKEEKKQRKNYGGGRSDDDNDSDDYKKREKRRSKEYGGNSGGGYGGNSGGYGEERSYGSQGRQEQQSYGGGRQEQSYGGGRQEHGSGRQEQSYGGGRQEYGGGRDEYSAGRQEQSFGGRQDEFSTGTREQTYGGGRQEQSYGGERQHQSYGGRDEMPGGFGNDDEDTSGYGQERRYGGGNSGYGEQQERRW